MSLKTFSAVRAAVVLDDLRRSGLNLQLQHRIAKLAQEGGLIDGSDGRDDAVNLARNRGVVRIGAGVDDVAAVDDEGMLVYERRVRRHDDLDVGIPAAGLRQEADVVVEADLDAEPHALDLEMRAWPLRPAARLVDDEAAVRLRRQDFH